MKARTKKVIAGLACTMTMAGGLAMAAALPATAAPGSASVTINDPEAGAVWAATSGANNGTGGIGPDGTGTQWTHSIEIGKDGYAPAAFARSGGTLPVTAIACTDQNGNGWPTRGGVISIEVNPGDAYNCNVSVGSEPGPGANSVPGQIGETKDLPLHLLCETGSFTGYSHWEDVPISSSYVFEDLGGAYYPHGWDYYVAPVDRFADADEFHRTTAVNPVDMGFGYGQSYAVKPELFKLVVDANASQNGGTFAEGVTTHWEVPVTDIPCPVSVTASWHINGFYQPSGPDNPVTPEPIEPVTPEPIEPEPITPDPIDPVVPEPIIDEPIVPAPINDEPVVDEPILEPQTPTAAWIG